MVEIGGQVQVECESDGNQVLQAGTQLSDPISNLDQEMRSRTLHTLT